MQNKVLSLVIPCYGKDNSIVRRTIESAVKNLNNDTEVVFVYKNSDKYNYDWVSYEFADKLTKIIKIDSGKKQHKIITALEHITSKFVIALDADDLINDEDFSNILSFLKSSENDLINMKVRVYSESLELIKTSIPFNYSEDKATIFKKNKVYFGNTSLIFKTEFLKSISKYLHDEILLGEDAERILISLTKTTNIGTMYLSLFKYIKYSDSESSSSNTQSKTGYDSVYKLINIYGKQSLGSIEKKNEKLYRSILFPYFFVLLNFWKKNNDLGCYKESISLLKEINNISYTQYYAMLFIYKITRFTLLFKRKV